MAIDKARLGILVDWQHIFNKFNDNFLNQIVYVIQFWSWFRCPCSPIQMTQRKKASAFLNLTLTTKIRGFSLSYMVTRDISHCMDREWDVWETFFWTFQFSIFIISQKKEREKNVICSSVAAYITCAIELILMGVLVDTVEQMSNSVVTIFSNLYRAYI